MPIFGLEGTPMLERNGIAAKVDQFRRPQANCAAIWV